MGVFSPPNWNTLKNKPSTISGYGITDEKCKAWVNFNGSTAAIRASYNVSSVTRNAAGDYTVNFTTAFADTNYAPQISLSTNSLNANLGTTANQRNGDVPTTTAFRFICTSESGSILSLLYDPTYVYFAAFR